MYRARGNGDDDEESCEELEFVPQCLLSHLRSCTIQNLGRLERDLILPMYILKNARVLQTNVLLLLSECPILEDLKLFHVYLECWFNESVVLKEFESLSLPKLTRTDIIECSRDILPLKAL